MWLDVGNTNFSTKCMALLMALVISISYPQKRHFHKKKTNKRSLPSLSNYYKKGGSRKDAKNGRLYNNRNIVEKNKKQK